MEALFKAQETPLHLRDLYNHVKNYIGWDDYKEIFTNFRRREYLDPNIINNECKISEIGINRYKQLQKERLSNSVSIKSGDTYNITNNNHLSVRGSHNHVNSSQSNSTFISDQQAEEAERVIEEIRREMKREIEKCSNLQAHDLRYIEEGIDEIAEKIGKREKVSPKTLFFLKSAAVASNLSSIASLFITLGQILGIIAVPTP